MTRIAIGDLHFNSDDFSKDLQAAVDLLLEVYLKERVGHRVIFISSSPTDMPTELFHPDHSSPNVIGDIFGALQIKEDVPVLDYYDCGEYMPQKTDLSDFDSYVPRMCFNKFLWMDPKIKHSQKKPRPGYSKSEFHRRCDMQIKSGINHRKRGKR